MAKSNASGVKLESLFNRRPDVAIKYLQDKKPQASIDYLEVKGRAHDQAFVVAKMTDMDMLADMQKSLINALENNMSYDEWQASVKPMLQKKGWWGKQNITLPDGRTAPAQLGSDYRLQRIYDTNINQAYHKARRHDGDYDIYPYAMWQSRGDDRVRPSHQSLDGQIFRRDDPYYQSIRPRVAWGCRCDEILLTAEQAGEYGEQDGYEIYDDISEYVSTESMIIQGTNGSYAAPVNIMRLPNRPAYRTDPGWIHAKDALPMQPMLDKAAQVPAQLASNSMQAVLARESVARRFNTDVKKWVYGENALADYRHVGALRPELLPVLERAGISVGSSVITLSAELAATGDKVWLADIARRLTGKYDVYLDTLSASTVLAFDSAGDKVLLYLNTRGTITTIESMSTTAIANNSNLVLLDQTL